MRTVLLLVVLSNSWLSAQKIIEKTIIDARITAFQINTTNCYETKIETIDSNEVIVEAIIEGEYQNDLTLKTQEEGSTIFINTGFRSNFKTPNDKLSAHKVISIALHIKLPKNKNVSVFGTSGKVLASGLYTSLKISLNDGDCTLNKTAEHTQVTTQSGNIYLNCASGIVVPNSKYGQIQADTIPKGKEKFKLNTITGSIFIKKIE